MKPLISVLMLSYNHGRFIQEALESISNNKSDSYDLEVIIIDDGSKDNSISIIEAFKNTEELPLKVIQKVHGGVNTISANFNELVALAQGDYITFLASDDRFTSNRFISQISMFQKDEDVVLSYGDGVNIDNGVILNSVMGETAKNILKSHSPKLALDYVTENIPTLFIQAVLIKSSFAKSISLFDEELIADDWVFNIRVFSKIVEMNLKIYFLDEVLFYRNIHDSNTSRNVEVHYKRIKQVFEKYCKPEFKRKILYRALFFAVVGYIKSKKYSSALKILKHELRGMKEYCTFSIVALNILAKKIF